MKFTVEIFPAAEADIRKQAQWYDKRRPGLGLEFTLEIYRTLKTLEENALLHSIRVKRKKTRWVYPRRFPYKGKYYIEERVVKVFAIRHAARRDRY